MTQNLKTLSSRAVTGAFFMRLEEVMAASWIGKIANMFDSNQESETYAFLSDAPAMKEWKGPRPKQTLKPFTFSLTNQKYSAALDIDEDDLRRDKTGQIMARVNELAVRAAQLPQKLISTLLLNNGNAYDGVAFFHDSGHVTESGATIDNITTSAAATGTSPTVAEAIDGVLLAIQQILGFRDDAGEPVNEFAKSFMVMCPPLLWAAIKGAVKNDFSSNGASNTLKASDFTIEAVMNPRLTWTDSIVVMRTDGDVKPFVWQDEVPTEVRTLDENSDYYTLNDAWLFAVKRVCAAGYGRFNGVCKHTWT